ncbi:MAG: signal peptidase I [Oscillospiraceae bacterium]|nr:signal peptidase I [Oscillospiraceae bacterium]
MAEELEHEPQPQDPQTAPPEDGAVPADGAAPAKEEKKPSEDLFYWLNALTTALVSLVLVFTFVGRLTRVQGESMTNTLQDQQLLLVWSLGYEPKQGDIVVLNKTTVEHLGGVAIVKRVIATGGQTVDIDYETNSVYVDGVLLDEPYIREPMDDVTADPNRTQTHFEVPEGEIFVMGDNRNNSDDSRDIRIGSIDEDYILGKAVFSLLPFDTIGPL